MTSCLRAGKLSHYVTSHPDPGQHSLVIPPWVGTVSTVSGDVTTTAWEENGEFCVAVVPTTRTAGIY